MFEGRRVAGILLMAGQGVRFGNSTPKQFHLLSGKRVFTYALDAFLASGLFDEILLVCPKDWMEAVREYGRSIEGGSTRQESSYRGLMGLEKVPDIVLIHDAVRPFVTEEILRKNVEEAIQQGAVDTCIPSADTLVHVPDGQKIAGIPKRAEYMRGQTPQTFQYDWIKKAHEKAVRDGIQNASDDCQLVLNTGKPVHVVRGSEDNLKITTEFDLILAEQIALKLKSRFPKIERPIYK